MVPEKRPLTYSDYIGWNDDKRWEIIDGQPFAMASPSTIHQLVVVALTVKLHSFFSKTPCRVLVSPMDVKLSESDIVQPDLLVVCNSTQIRATHVEGPPQIIIEVSSPTTHRHDRIRKMALYSRAGVPEYWLVTPHPFMAEVLKNQDGLYSIVKACSETEVLTSPSFPELTLDLREIFESLPPQPEIDEVREGVPPYAERT